MDTRKEQEANGKPKEEISRLTDEQVAKLDELWRQGENICQSAEIFPFHRRPKVKNK